MAVDFLATSVFKRSVCIPGHRVQMFQLAIQSAGYFFLISILFTGAWVYGSLFGFDTLIPMHSMGQVSHGGTSPYLLGAAQLRRVVDAQ